MLPRKLFAPWVLGPTGCASSCVISSLTFDLDHIQTTDTCKSHTGQAARWARSMKSTQSGPMVVACVALMGRNVQVGLPDLTSRVWTGYGLLGASAHRPLGPALRLVYNLAGSQLPDAVNSGTASLAPWAARRPRGPHQAERCPGGAGGICRAGRAWG